MVTCHSKLGTSYYRNALVGIGMVLWFLYEQKDRLLPKREMPSVAAPTLAQTTFSKLKDKALNFGFSSSGGESTAAKTAAAAGNMLGISWSTIALLGLFAGAAGGIYLYKRYWERTGVHNDVKIHITLNGVPCPPTNVQVEPPKQAAPAA